MLRSLLLALLLLPAPVLACLCLPVESIPTLLKEKQHALFVGEVVNKTWSKKYKTWHIRMQVDKAWAGKLDRFVTLATDSVESECGLGLWFEEGKRYFVQAAYRLRHDSDDPAYLYCNTCGQTASGPEAEKRISYIELAGVTTLKHPLTLAKDTGTLESWMEARKGFGTPGIKQHTVNRRAFMTLHVIPASGVDFNYLYTYARKNEAWVLHDFKIVQGLVNTVTVTKDAKHIGFYNQDLLLHKVRLKK